MLLKGQRQVEYAKAFGGVMSIEIKREKIPFGGIPTFTHDLALRTRAISFATVERVVRTDWRFLHRGCSRILR